MKLIGFRNKIAGTLFALSLLFGFSLATSVTAERNIVMIATNATEIETIVTRDVETAITIGATTTGAEVVTTTATRILVAHST